MGDKDSWYKNKTVNKQTPVDKQTVKKDRGFGSRGVQSNVKKIKDVRFESRHVLYDAVPDSFYNPNIKKDKEKDKE